MVVDGCLLFVMCCSLLSGCLLFMVWLVVVGCCLLFVVVHVLAFGLRCLLCVVCCL